MSVRTLSWAWDQPTATPADKLVLVALADHADDTGVCWPGLDRITAKTGIPRRTVQRAIRRLEERGLLRRDAQRNPDGTHARTVYHLSSTAPAYPPEPADEPDDAPGATPDEAPAEAAGDRAPSPGANMAPRPATGRHIDRAPGATRARVEEPSVEPSGTTTPPIPPRGGNRARDRQAYEDELAAWTERHIGPGFDPRLVRHALSYDVRGADGELRPPASAAEVIHVLGARGFATEVHAAQARRRSA